MQKLRLRGEVGRKTANGVLGNAFKINAGIGVDTHGRRLAQRLGLTRQEDPEKIENELMKLVPRNDWTNFSHWLIWHGRRCCYAQRPDCAHCGLATICPSFEELSKLTAGTKSKKASEVSKRSVPAARQRQQAACGLLRYG